MSIKPFKLYLLVSLAVLLLTSHLKASTLSDSIRISMKVLSGQELLQAHSNLCRLAAAEDNPKSELACLRAYIKEANEQKNVVAEGLARSMQTMCYYNNYMIDSLKSALPGNLEFMAKHSLWDDYYNVWNTLVEFYIYNDKLQTALVEADKMYADAMENKSNYGIGVSAYCMGSIYQTTQRFEQAKKSFLESIQTLSKEEDISLLLSAYNALGETLDGLGEYEELGRIALEWKAVIDKYKSEALAKGNTPSLNGRYLYCTLAAAIAEIETNNCDKAADLLADAQVYAHGRKQISRYKLLQVQARYYAATNQYAKAIECNEENMAILVFYGDSVSLLTVQLQQADFFLSQGSYKESALLYKQIIPRKDKLRNSELAAQLDELRTIYEVDKLTLKNKLTTNRLYFAIIYATLLLIVFILYIIYTRRMRRKNRVLYDTIVQRQKIQDNLYLCNEETLQEQASSEDILYRKLCKLMKEQQLFKDPQIKREDLAVKLNTNRTYLTDAIKNSGEGLTFNEYVNSYRIRYAATLLTDNLSLTINEIGDDSGFNSRSTYSRLFRDFYGMSPSEYRAISKEKKIK